MPLNERKVIEIIMGECNSLEERCTGYRDELVEVVADIIHTERQHRVQGTNIQQKIADKINATGRFLTERREKSNRSDGGLS